MEEKNNDNGSVLIDGLRIPESPIGFITIEDGNNLSNYAEQQRKEEKMLQDNLARYGITYEEWEELEKYKRNEYFLPSTLLHRIDLLKYNMPEYGGVFDNTDWFDPEKAVNSYCKIYSAMCKFAKRYNKEIQIGRVDSKIFSDEMRISGRTEGMLSCSRDGYQLKFMEGKNGVEFLNGLLERGVPCIDFTELLGNDGEAEVLIPPFLNLNYNEDSEVLNAYTQHNVYISSSNHGKLSEEENARMEELRQLIIGTQIPNDYYSHWYNSVRSDLSYKGDNDNNYIELREKFFSWQDKFKEYLQLRFRQIENEIYYPQLKPRDFIKWGVQRSKRGGDFFKEKMQQAGNWLKQIIDNFIGMDR